MDFATSTTALKTETLTLNWHTFHVLQEDFSRCTWCYWETGPWFEHGDSAAWQYKVWLLKGASQLFGCWPPLPGTDLRTCISSPLSAASRRVRLSTTQPCQNKTVPLPSHQGCRWPWAFGVSFFSLDQNLIPPRHAVPHINARELLRVHLMTIDW